MEEPLNAYNNATRPGRAWPMAARTLPAMATLISSLPDKATYLRCFIK